MCVCKTMPTKCQFKFSRPTPIYYSGEQITGSIILSTTKQLPVEAIQLSLIGYQRVQWLERSKAELLLHNDSIEKDNKVSYSGSRQCLYESHKLAKSLRLLPGEVLVEDFNFTLPNDAHASSSLKYGEVVYSLVLTLYRKSNFNKVYKARITIKNRLDLNVLPDLGKRYTTLNAKDVHSANEQPLRFSLPNGTGYVPGQRIAYTLQGRHTYAGACNKLLVNLCQRSTFRATNPEMKIKELCYVLKSVVQKLSSSSSYVNVEEQLSLPLSTCISMKGNDGDLIQTKHYVEAMLISKKRILQKFIVPILVGTVPLRRGTMEVHEDTVDYFYCYDNLATDANCDRASENIVSKSASSTILPALASKLRCNSWATSAPNMLQQDVAMSSKRTALT